MSFVVVFPHGHSFGVKDRQGLENFLAHRVLISNFTPLIDRSRISTNQGPIYVICKYRALTF